MGDDRSAKPRPRRLGRGLSALVDAGGAPGTETGAGERPRPVAIEPAALSDAAPDTDGTYDWVLIGSIEAGRYQPRREFDDEALGELAASIARSGVIQPIVVRRGAGGKHELISGERRWRAARLAGLQRIPAIVRDVSDREAAEWAIVENVQREDLNAVERALAFKRLADEFGQTHEQIAEAVGVKRPTVANLIRLLDLGEDILALIASGHLSAGHGKALLAEPDPARRRKLADQAARDEWSVRRIEGEAGRATTGTAGGHPPPDKQQSSRDITLRDLEKQLGDHLGAKVSLKTDASGTKGRISIEFYSLDHFDGLMRRLGAHDSVGSNT